MHSIFGIAQNPYSVRIDKTNGLPGNSVYDIHQDKRGFMWFATNKGICRYDGTVFKTYSSKKATNKAGSNLEEDLKGQMWYVNFDGYIYKTQKDSLVKISNESALGYMPFGIVGDNMFSIQKNSIVAQNIDTNKIIATFKLNHLFVTNAFAAKNEFIVLSDKITIITKNLEIKQIEIPSNINKTSVYVICKVGNKIYFVSKIGGSYYTLENSVFTKYQLEETNFMIQNVSVIDNQIWLSSTAGVAKLVDNKLEKYYENINISNIFKDKDGNYWIATLNEGLLLINDFNKKLIETTEPPITLFQKNGALFYGSVSNGLWQYDIEKKSQKIIDKTTSNHEVYVAKNLDRYSFTTAAIFSVYDNQNKRILSEPIAVKDIVKIDEKYFAVAASGFNGMFCIDKNLKSSWDSFFEKQKAPRSTIGFREFQYQMGYKGKSVAFNTANQSLYFSTNKGVFRVSQNGILNFKVACNDLFLNNLSSYKDIVIGLEADGSFYSIDTQNKLKKFVIPELQAINIIKYKLLKNLLFIYSDNAILTYNLETKTLVTVLNTNQNLDVTDIENINNKLIFATKKGLIIKDDNASVKKQLPDFFLNNVVVNNQQIFDRMPKKLKPNENTIALNFSVLNYSLDYQYPIHYNINNKKWYKLDQKSTNLLLNELAFGVYDIQIRIYNTDKSQFKEIKLSFEIEKPFYKAFWFLLFLMSIIFAAIYYIYRIQLKNINKINTEKLEKSNLERDFSKSKLKAIKSQMNPHFFYNALNTIQSYILTNDKKMALDYLSKFSNLTRTILEFSEKDYVTIAEEIETLTLYLDLEKARFDDNDMNFKIKTENIINQNTIKIPAMLLQPYIENALKHGLLHKKGAKNLEITFVLKQKILEISIIDNGVGRAQSAFINKNRDTHKKSFATTAMTNRIDILNQQNDFKLNMIIIDNKNEFDQATGTIVTFEIDIE